MSEQVDLAIAEADEEVDVAIAEADYMTSAERRAAAEFSLMMCEMGGP